MAFTDVIDDQDFEALRKVAELQEDIIEEHKETPIVIAAATAAWFWFIYVYLIKRV